MCLIQGESEVSTDHCYVSVSFVIMAPSPMFSYLFGICLFAAGSSYPPSIRSQQYRRECAATPAHPAHQRFHNVWVHARGLLTSFVVLAWYQVDPDNFGLINLHDGLRNWIPPSVFVDVFAFLIIFAGKVLYQWDPDPEVEATTLSAEDKEAMSLLDGEDDYGLRYT